MIDMHMTDMMKPRTRNARREVPSRRPPKARITISLSRERVRFLKAHSAQRGDPSVSAYIERLVADAQRRAALERLSAQAALYYDSLPPKEAEELSAWGGLGELGLAGEEE